MADRRSPVAGSGSPGWPGPGRVGGDRIAYAAGSRGPGLSGWLPGRRAVVGASVGGAGAVAVQGGAPRGDRGGGAVGVGGELPADAVDVVVVVREAEVHQV